MFIGRFYMNEYIRKPELLSPAGNFEKLKAALLYGADAVYLAGQSFGMRSAADNFTVEELLDISTNCAIFVMGIIVYTKPHKDDTTFI